MSLLGLPLFQELMIVIYLGAADLLKLSAANCMPMLDRLGAGGADGPGSTGVCGEGFAQNFFHRGNKIKPSKSTIPIIAAGDENNQCKDWKFLEQFTCIKCSSNLGLQFCNYLSNLFAVGVVKKLCQRHCKIQPS